MSADTASSPGPFCGCIGCREDAVAVIDHPEHGHRTVCADDINGHEVVRRV